MGHVISKKLNEKQELFCKLYATDKEFFGDGLETYIEVYQPDETKPNWRKSASASVSRMLINISLIERINELLDENGFNDLQVKKQHSFLITQHADLGVKQRAVSDFYKLKGKYAPDQVKIELINVEEIKNRITNLKKKV